MQLVEHGETLFFKTAEQVRPCMTHNGLAVYGTHLSDTARPTRLA